mgnify:CR=1 FL=1
MDIFSISTHRTLLYLVRMDIKPIEKCGDVVTLVGKDGNQEITLDELANLVGTINYELACDINVRATRVYIK